MTKVVSMVLAQRGITCGLRIIKNPNQHIWCFMENLESKVGNCLQSSSSTNGARSLETHLPPRRQSPPPSFCFAIRISASPVPPPSPPSAPAQHSPPPPQQRLDVIGHREEPGFWLPRHSPSSLQDRALPSDGS